METLSEAVQEYKEKISRIDRPVTQILGAWLTLNRTCNFRCRWCYAKGTHYSKSDDMTEDLAFKLLKILKDLNVLDLSLIGGEPLLWPHLFDFLMQIEKPMICGLVTNGYMFGIDSLWEKYLKFPAIDAGISLKAGNAKQYQELTGLRNFKTLIKGAKRYFSVHPDNGGAQLTYNICYQQNLPEIVQLAMDCGAEGIQIDFCSVVINLELRNSPLFAYVSIKGYNYFS